MWREVQTEVSIIVIIVGLLLCGLAVTVALSAPNPNQETLSFRPQTAKEEISRKPRCTTTRVFT